MKSKRFTVKSKQKGMNETKEKDVYKQKREIRDILLPLLK